MIYLNDNDAYAAAWLRNLYPKAEVDARSITELRTRDVDSCERVHLFAGIGGWELALQLAGFPEDVRVWTGSCPCQPFSAAGKRKGVDDERHLWPEFYRLIRECRPPVIFGEQVASKDGRLWLAGVRADLEALGYVVGAADLCAAGVGAPHIRQRLYWGAARLDGLADTKHSKWRPEFQKDRNSPRWDGLGRRSDVGGLADSPELRRDERRAGQGAEVQGERAERSGEYAGPEYSGLVAGRFEGLCAVDGLANSDNQGSQGWLIRRDGTRERLAGQAGVGSWSRFGIIECADDKFRRIPAEPEFFPLAHGVPARVGKLRAYGNAIVPQVAAEFVAAFMESIHELT